MCVNSECYIVLVKEHGHHLIWLQVTLFIYPFKVTAVLLYCSTNWHILAKLKYVDNLKWYKMNETIPITCMSYGTELCQFANADFKWIVNTKNVNKNMTQAYLNNKKC